MAQRSKRGRGLGVVDGLLVGVIAVIGLLMAFFFLSFLAGFAWELIKVALVVGVVLLVLWAFLGRKR
jgi:hypothetical protein